eukprot:6900773-Prymnesium_polylepis.1
MLVAEVAAVIMADGDEAIGGEAVAEVRARPRLPAAKEANVVLPSPTASATSTSTKPSPRTDPGKGEKGPRASHGERRHRSRSGSSNKERADSADGDAHPRSRLSKHLPSPPSSKSLRRQPSGGSKLALVSSGAATPGTVQAYPECPPAADGSGAAQSMRQRCLAPEMVAQWEVRAAGRHPIPIQHPNDPPDAP